MRNKSALKMKKECNITWRKGVKWHKNNRAQHFNARGKHYERLIFRAYAFISNRKDFDDEEEY